jgi:hypothetical protein
MGSDVAAALVATVWLDPDPDLLNALLARFELGLNAGATDFVTAECWLEPVTPDAETNGHAAPGTCGCRAGLPVARACGTGPRREAGH